MVINIITRFFLPNVEIQTRIGAAPSDSAAPVAINFLVPKAEENAC
jgi:hypothetical protein